MMGNQEIIAVVQAGAAGKAIECRHINADPDVWRPFHGIGYWDFGHYDYRIKPEKPREFWINRFNSFVGYGVPCTTEAEAAIESKGVAIERIHVREVLP